MENRKIALINPFVINVAPMERLLLVNIEKDPDTVYIGFEPQVFNDSIHGKGHLIIAWRQDGKVDVYHEGSLTLQREGYDIVGKGLENMVETDFSHAAYEVEESGVQANYQFDDCYGRRVSIYINENNPKKRKPFGLLAPMGDAAENPSALPLILLHDFYFVRKKATELVISIDNKLHQPDGLPMPMDGVNMFFSRYSPCPLIARFNPAFDGKLVPLHLSPGQERVTCSEYDIDIQWENQQAGIKRIIRKNGIHPLTLDFPDTFPNIHTLKSTRPYEGSFIISGDPTTGSIKGHYTLEKKEDATNITLIPSGGWIPKPTKLSLRFLYTAAKIFKHWPKTYQWSASIFHHKDTDFSMNSSWERI